MNGYRPEVDGLRAVAVVSVLLFHAEIPGFEGGFVGVDVFFVISGYLITSILLRDIAAGRFSFADFYRRRAKRIMPALIAMWAAVFGVGMLVLLPGDLTKLATSLGGSALFVSNFVFLGETGYFGGAATHKPLLHTWSLSIEEQFYLIWPFALLLAARFLPPRVGFALLLVAIAASLWHAQARLDQSPEAAFYLLPSRFWELGLGAALAWLGTWHRPSARARELAAAGGALCLVGSLLFIDKSVAFPGLGALPACAGAALLIYGGAGSRVGRALSLRPVVFVGLISYSLYLWHWPVFAYTHVLWGGIPSLWVAAAGIALSLVLAVASWRWIEQPFRRGSAEVSAGRTIRWLGVVPICLVVIFSAHVIASGGMKWRVPAEAAAYDALVADSLALYEVCHLREDGAPLASATECLFGATGDSPDFLLYGDSHAQHLLPALHASALEAGLTGGAVTQGGCPPAVRPDVAMMTKGRVKRSCADKRALFKKALSVNPEIRFVVLAARWSLYAPEETRAQGRGLGYLDGRVAGSAADLLTEELAEISRFLREEHGLPVVIVGQVPLLGREGQSCVRRALLFSGDIEACRPSYAAAVGPVERGRAAARAAAEASPGAIWIDPVRGMCPEGNCLASPGLLTGYRDDDHLNPKGSELVSDIFPPELMARLAGR